MRKIRIDVDQGGLFSLTIAALLVPATVFPFFQTGDSTGNSERLHPIADIHRSTTQKRPESA
jgi:hypothetical protein